MAEETVEFEVDSNVTTEDDDNWSEISTSPKPTDSPKVEFEIDAPEKGQTTTKEVSTQKEVQKEPVELDGIETKGAQKRIKQLIRQRKDREDELAKRDVELQALRAELENSKRSSSNITKSNLDLTGTQLTEKLASVKAHYKRALDDDDSEAIVNAQEALSQTQAEIMLLERDKEGFTEYTEPEIVKAPQSTTIQKSELPEVLTKWIDTNDWFGGEEHHDRLMTTTALAIDTQMKDEGWDPEDADFYEEVDVRLRQKLPKKFQDEEVTPHGPASPARQVVAGTSRSPAPGSTSKVKLTQEDVEMASRWGISLERYAFQKREAELADGEYTEINIQRGGS